MGVDLELPDPLPIAPRAAIDARIALPGSKSLSNRALLVAALAEGRSRLPGILESDDTLVLRDALVSLGAGIFAEADGWVVDGTGGVLSDPEKPIYVGASGTAARFLSAAAALAPNPVTLDGTPRMRERPIDDLAQALDRLGCRVEVLGRNGCPPLRVAGGGLEGGRVRIDARRSSQYVSAVLLVAPYARKNVELDLEGGVLPSRPYVDLTLDVMAAFGARAEWTPHGTLFAEAGRTYRARDFAIEPDASTAAYFFCAAAICGGRVQIDGLLPTSRQADLGLLRILEAMGCRVESSSRGIEVRRAGRLRGIAVDMNAMPDAVLALAVTALFAEGPTVIRNVANLRIKESDRLAALECELNKLGARAHTSEDSLTIEPGPLRGAEIATYDDHRMAMAFALAGLRVPGVTIRDPGCVRKSWPGYFVALESL